MAKKSSQFEKKEPHAVEALQRMEINIKTNEISFFSKNSNITVSIIEKKDSDVDFFHFIKGPFCKRTKTRLYVSSGGNLAISMPKEYINALRIIQKSLI